MVKKLKKKPRVCFVLNIAPIYRKALLESLDSCVKVDFFFTAGDSDMQIAVLTDISELSGFKGYLKNKFKGIKLVYQTGWFKLLFGKYDAFILTGNTGIRSNWMLAILARLSGKKVYLWSHGLHGAESFIERTKKLSLMKIASGLLLYGHYGKSKLIKQGYPAKKMTVVYNSLDTASQKLLRGREENKLFLRNYFATDAPIALFLGRLTPQKSLHILIEAIGVLKLQKIECNAIIVGAGEIELSLRDKCKEVGVEDNFWFYGDCYDESMLATLLKCSTICVSPGNVGLTAMHALTYGIPVITHSTLTKQVPEFEAIIKGVTGDFFRYNDSIALADIMHVWIQKLADPKAKQECQEACYKMIDNCYNTESQTSIIEARILADFR